MSIMANLKNTCKTELDAIVAETNRITGCDVKLRTVKYIGCERIEYQPTRCKASATFDADHTPLRCKLDFKTDDDGNIKCMTNKDDIVEAFAGVLDSAKHSIDAAANIPSDKDTVHAADGLASVDDTINDNIDQLSDTIDDLQDAVEDIDESDVDIELDNNIDGHYVAECDNCHGVFISAMLESDQHVEKISGTCPLCNKETDQYLKWVIKSVND